MPSSRRKNKNKKKRAAKNTGPFAPLDKLLSAAGISGVSGVLLIRGRGMEASTLKNSDARSAKVARAVLDLLDSSEECSRKIRQASLKFPGASLYIRCLRNHVVVIEMEGKEEVDLAALGEVAQEFLVGLKEPEVAASRSGASPVKRKIGGARVALSPEDIAALTGRGLFPSGAPVTGLALSS